MTGSPETRRIQEAWNLQNGEILKSADQITSRLNQTSMNVSGEEFDMTNLKVTYEQLSSNFSQEYGGFSKAPKFPSPQKLLFLIFPLLIKLLLIIEIFPK